jgi:hypothetical protein
MEGGSNQMGGIDFKEGFKIVTYTAVHGLVYAVKIKFIIEF